MNHRWLLAKYVPDLERNEPRNIGLVLLYHDQVFTRFIGQQADGNINGRQARQVNSLETYKAWVSHWRSLATGRTAQDNLLAEAVGSRSGGNYYLEPAGEILSGNALASDATVLMENLYSRLVEGQPDAAVESVSRLAETAVRGVEQRLPNYIARDSLVAIPYEDHTDELTFDYSYENGKQHLLQNVGLTLADGRSWDRVHAVYYTFSQLEKTEDEKLRDADCIALVKTRSSDRALGQQLRHLERLAHVVDVTDTAKAEQDLYDLMA